MSCPDPERVLDYLARRLDIGARDAVELHVDGCEACRLLLVELAESTELPDLVAIDPTREPRVRSATASLDGSLERYEIGDVLGSGGMGEVRLARDLKIDREVAVKLMRATDRSVIATTRFLREAHVQGGLEHPAVVPVHDLGVDRDGTPYFVMKRLAGTTLAEMLATGSASRRQLLTKLADVALAIEFAHTRGVVHRDLKPANIMLGDFGEVYVLDWGLARAADDPDEPTGDLLGTLGYMAPEQVRRERIDARADVFALGCVLYEVLAGKPALPRGRDAIAATLAATEHRPSVSATAPVPPELDDLCARATASDPTVRPTARAFASAIEAYLDGDRDLIRRRELSEHHTGLAEVALEGLADAADEARATAMSEAGRALALQPDNARAQAVLGRVMLESPRVIPREALASADEERARTRTHVVRRAAIAYLGLAAVIPIFLVFPLHHVWAVIAAAGVNVAMGALILVLSRHVIPMRSRWYFVTLFGNWLVLAVGSVMLGPLLIIPFYVIGSVAVWLNLPTGYPSWITVAAHLLAIVPVVILELLNILPPSFAIVGTSLVFTPRAIDLSPLSTGILFAVAFFSQFTATSLIVIHSRRVHDAMQDRLHAHSWHLQQLLPKNAGANEPPTPARSHRSSPWRRQ